MSAGVLSFKNQNDNLRTVLLDSLIMPYAHIHVLLLCAYVLIKISAHWHNIHVRRPYIYESRQAILSTEWGKLTLAMLLWFSLLILWNCLLFEPRCPWPQFTRGKTEFVWQQKFDSTFICGINHASWSNTLIHFILWTRWIAGYSKSALYVGLICCWCEVF